MSVGNITNFDNLITTSGITGYLHKANIISGQADNIFDIGRSVASSWGFGTGAGNVNQAVTIIFTATKNTTTVLDLNAALTNAIGDLLSTFTKVKYFKVEYLTTAQDATNGNASTGTITISPTASTGVTTSFLGSSGSIVLNPGAVFTWQDLLNGFTVTAATADQLDFIHSDNVLDAKLRLTILGEK